MSEPESFSPHTPGEIARLSAKDQLTSLEQSGDSVAAGLATHLKKVMSDSQEHLCFKDSRTLAEQILSDPAYKDAKIYYWFLMQDSEAPTEEELRENYATLLEVMAELDNPEQLSYEQFLEIGENGPATHTNHFALLVRSADRTFYLDPVGFLSAGVQPGLRELPPTAAPQDISNNSHFYQMTSTHPITIEHPNRAPDPVFLDDRRPFVLVSELD